MKRSSAIPNLASCNATNRTRDQLLDDLAAALHRIALDGMQMVTLTFAV